MQVVEKKSHTSIPIKAIYNRSGTVEKELFAQDIAEIPNYVKKTLFKTLPHKVIQPTTEEALKQIINEAKEKKLTIIPRGAASYGFGGITPVKGGLLVDISLLNQIIEFNPEKNIITVRAGIRWSDLENYLESRGYTVKTHPSSWFSTVGGWLATGGYGFNNFKYGHFSKNIEFIDVIDAQGELRRIYSTDKDFENYVGTEGQMGIVVNIGLQVRRRPKKEFVRMFHFEDEKSAFEFIERLLKEEIDATNVIYYNAHKMEVLNKIVGENLLAEKETVIVSFDDQEAYNKFENLVRDFSNINQSSKYATLYVWNERLFTFKAKRIRKGYLASEHIFPISSLLSFLDRLKSVSKKYKRAFSVQAYLVNREEALVITSYLTDPKRKIGSLIDLMMVMYLMKLGIKYRGKPYGVGIWNNGFKYYKIPPKKFEELKAYKQKVDPDGLFNRGKFFDLKTRFLGIPGLFFKPFLFNIVIKLIGPIMRLLKIFEGAPNITEKEKMSTSIEDIAHMCSNCGSCVSVCPGYLYTKSELSTARGKLFLIRNFDRLKNKLTKEEVVNVFACLYCKNCEAVCQSGLQLMDVWLELEKRLEKIYGRPTEEINEFIKTMEYAPEYIRFLDQSPNTFKVEQFFIEMDKRERK